MKAQLVYRSVWSSIEPLVYTDDANIQSVNKLVDTIFRSRTNRLTFKSGKFYYTPSNEYKEYVIRMKKFK